MRVYKQLALLSKPLLRGGPAPNGEQIAWCLIKLSLGTHQAAVPSHCLPPLCGPSRTESHCKMLPLNPSSGLRYFSRLLWRCSNPSPSLQWHKNSQHNPSPGHHYPEQKNSDRQGWGRAAAGAEAWQEVLMALEPGMRPVSISRPEPLVYGFTLFVVPVLSLLPRHG